MTAVTFLRGGGRRSLWWEEYEIKVKKERKAEKGVGIYKSSTIPNRTVALYEDTF